MKSIMTAAAAFAVVATNLSHACTSAPSGVNPAHGCRGEPMCREPLGQSSRAFNTGARKEWDKFAKYARHGTGPSGLKPAYNGSELGALFGNDISEKSAAAIDGRESYPGVVRSATNNKRTGDGEQATSDRLT
jgi:hypothetical protein